MGNIGFDNEQYLRTQSEKIRERVQLFGGKLYMEFGGKLFDDYHASRVLPGFLPDSKVKMLLQMKDQAEIVIVISAGDIEKNKVRGDLGITYDVDVLRLIDAFRGIGLYVGSVVLTQYNAQPAAEAFQKRLESLGVKVFRHYTIPGYPSNIPLIVSDEGFGKNEYVETSRSLVVVTAPGPGSGKMATCLSQLYHEYKRGVKAGYAKFETFPIWNLPLNHPVNLAYEAATADLNDVNMIDPFHLEAYGETAVNYNRDVEVFPVLNAMLEKIMGQSPYKSPTDMGVNMAGNCIVDDKACCGAACQEIIHRGRGVQGGAADEQGRHHPPGQARHRPGLKARRGNRPARRGHPAAGWAHRHRQDLLPAGGQLRLPAQRLKGPGRHLQGYPPHLPHCHRAHPKAEDHPSGQREPPAAHR